MNSKESNLDEVICPCSGTTKRKVKALFEEGLDVEAISRRTGAISGCSGCEWDIADYLTELANQPQK